MNKTDNIFIIQQKLQQQKKAEEKSNLILNINKNKKNQCDENVSFSASTSSPAPSSPLPRTFNKNTSPTSATPISTINNNFKKNVTTSPISSVSSTTNITTPPPVKKTPPPVPPRNFVNSPPNLDKLPKNPPPPVPPKPINYMKKNNIENNNTNNNDINNIYNNSNNNIPEIKDIENEYKKLSIEIPDNNDNNIDLINTPTQKEADDDMHTIKTAFNSNTPNTPTPISIDTSVEITDINIHPQVVTPPPYLSPIDSPQCNSTEYFSPQFNSPTLYSPALYSPLNEWSTPSGESPEYKSPTINIILPPTPNDIPQITGESTSLSTSVEIKLSNSKPPRDPNSSPVLVKRSVSIMENLSQKSLLSPSTALNLMPRKLNTSGERSSGSIAPPPSPTSSKTGHHQSLSTSLGLDYQEGKPQRVLTRRVASSNLLKEDAANENSTNSKTFIMSSSTYNLRSDGIEDDEENSPPPTPSKHQRAHSLNNESYSSATISFNLRDSFEKIIPGSSKSEIKGILIEKLDIQHCKIQQKEPRKLKLPAIDSTTRLNKRIAEMIETEADYIDDLETTLNLYLFAFTEMEKLKIITHNDIKSIFSNIEELYHVSLKLYPMLLKTIPLLEQKQYPNIEEIFLNNFKAFQRYGPYLSSYEQSNKFLENLIEKNEIVKFIIDHIKNKLPLSKLLDLHAYQIKPCQRLCKYPLLLKDAKSAVPESEELHHKTFERAVKLMEKIVNDINGKISNDEKIQLIVKEIGKEIETLIHHQTFLKESKVKKLKKKNTVKEIQIFILDQNIILYEKGTFKKKHKVISFSKISRVCDHESKTPNSFGVYYTKDGSPTKTLSIQTDTNKEKTDLMNLIDETLQSYKYINGDNNNFLYITNNNNNPNLSRNNFNTIRQKNNDKDGFVFF
ncbi:hypothetical protein DICPUDRAFT_77025 [Dictyostelium purpureum]|uniref:DH domain-containing protein n=1 Tax=Dictyostelium purpureum TaxID=5786 RepID=F0ZFD7_DICPU|nr:uncharacterized protein DICPUDRAFT_77025 [Dictyostelium purpureum]EGC37315.1 hypothetical protein DICPUDRAFT_77025 [Dictyostelium purpureum]|eukprot:XP_003286129.1 hypothetical protein DICPUDRAFT_77025 [Dictyostelium purpureum]